MSDWEANIGYWGWKDGGWIEFKYEDGTILKGFLEMDDVHFNGEDEYPIFSCKSEDGSFIDIWEPEYCRYIDG